MSTGTNFLFYCLLMYLWHYNVFSYKELLSLYTCHYTKDEVINMLDK